MELQGDRSPTLLASSGRLSICIGLGVPGSHVGLHRMLRSSQGSRGTRAALSGAGRAAERLESPKESQVPRPEAGAAVHYAWLHGQREIPSRAQWGVNGVLLWLLAQSRPPGLGNLPCIAASAGAQGFRFPPPQVRDVYVDCGMQLVPRSADLPGSRGL